MCNSVLLFNSNNNQFSRNRLSAMEICRGHRDYRCLEIGVASATGGGGLARGAAKDEAKGRPNRRVEKAVEEEKGVKVTVWRGVRGGRRESRVRLYVAQRKYTLDTERRKGEASVCARESERCALRIRVMGKSIRGRAGTVRRPAKKVSRIRRARTVPGCFSSISKKWKLNVEPSS